MAKKLHWARNITHDFAVLTDQNATEVFGAVLPEVDGVEWLAFSCGRGFVSGDHRDAFRLAKEKCEQCLRKSEFEFEVE